MDILKKKVTADEKARKRGIAKDKAGAKTRAKNLKKGMLKNLATSLENEEKKETGEGEHQNLIIRARAEQQASDIIQGIDIGPVSRFQKPPTLREKQLLAEAIKRRVEFNKILETGEAIDIDLGEFERKPIREVSDLPSGIPEAKVSDTLPYQPVYDERVASILESEITPDILRICRERLSRALNEYSPNPNYTEDSKFVNRVINLCSEGSYTVDELLTKVGILISYITQPYAVALHERLSRMMYIPDVLVTLTPMELFPEASMVTMDLETNTNVNAETFINTTALEIYQDRHPAERVNIIYKPAVNVVGNVKSLKTQCVNPSDFAKIDEYDIALYEEEDDVYCFSIQKLLQELEENDVVLNPYTGTPIDERFLSRVREIYSRNIEDYNEVIVREEPEEVVEAEVDESAITELYAIIDDCYKKLKNKDKCTLPMKLDEHEVFNQSPESSVKCEKCGDDVEMCKSLKSKIKIGKEYSTIYLCSFKCFEDYDKWHSK
jgi:hypothetical protein